MSDFVISFTSIEQKSETTPTCDVDVNFSVLGPKSSIDILQVYATPQASLSGIGSLADTVEMNAESQYTSHLTLQTGTIYTLGLCPRHVSNGAPDDTIGGDYWETFCIFANFATHGSDSHTRKPIPIVALRQARAKTLRDPNRLDISWVVPPWSDGDNSYHAFNVRWYPAGAPQSAVQQNVNSGGTNGLWTCAPLSPNTEYAIGVQGEDTWAYVHYVESDWGVLTARSADNHHSLREFLADSGVDGGSGVRRILGNGARSLREIMGIGV
jgi:hypothetical protein